MVFKRILHKVTHSVSTLFNGKKCCICESRFENYLPTGTDSKVWKELHGVGAGMRKATCPNCGSTDRERLIYLFLKEKYLPQLNEKRIKVLHIAPEAQLSSFLRSLPQIEYTAGDKRCEGYNYPSYVKNLDIMSMPDIADNTYDIIICNHVLEHVPNDITAMKELYRILKHDGIAILQVPIALELEHTIEDSSITTPEARFENYGQSDHVRLYGTDYPERLNKAGFKVELLNIASKYNNKFGLNKDELLHICHKK